MIWGSSPTPSDPHKSGSSTDDTQEERDNLLTGEGRWGWVRILIVRVYDGVEAWYSINLSIVTCTEPHKRIQPKFFLELSSVFIT
jgi:hypothetical protein